MCALSLVIRKICLRLAPSALVRLVWKFLAQFRCNAAGLSMISPVLSAANQWHGCDRQVFCAHAASREIPHSGRLPDHRAKNQGGDSPRIWRIPGDHVALIRPVFESSGHPWRPAAKPGRSGSAAQALHMSVAISKGARLGLGCGPTNIRKQGAPHLGSCSR